MRWRLRKTGQFGWSHWTVTDRLQIPEAPGDPASSFPGPWPWTVTTSRSLQRRWTCALLTESVGHRTAKDASATRCRSLRAALLASVQRTNLPRGFHSGNARFTSNRTRKHNQQLRNHALTASLPRKSQQFGKVLPVKAQQKTDSFRHPSLQGKPKTDDGIQLNILFAVWTRPIMCPRYFTVSFLPQIKISFKIIVILTLHWKICFIDYLNYFKSTQENAKVTYVSPLVV